MHRFLLPVLFCLLPFMAEAQFYNGSQTDFGKNRLQFQDFKWNYLRFPKYDVYYNTGGKEMAIYVARTAKNHLADIERFFDYPLESRIEFVVYNKQEDFKQSNAGYTNDDNANVGGTTRLAGTKVFLYYEGDHLRLEEQIRAGIAEIILNQMMYGGNARDMIKNSTLLSLPEWYTKGLISYVAQGWNTDIDSRVRDGILTGRFRKFNHLTGEDARLAGHSIWYYISEKYSPGVIPNILYMTRVSRNVESAMLFVIGTSVKVLAIEWQGYFRERYLSEDTTRTLPGGLKPVARPKAAYHYSQARISPDGKQICYVTNELGQTKLWLQDLQSGKRKRLLKLGHKIDRINDYSYPLVSWHPGSKLLSWIYEKAGETFLVIYEPETGDIIEKPIYSFIKIIDFSYSPDGTQFVMSAVQNGQTDIFLYTISGGAITPLTKDVYDDLNPRFVDGGRSIVFSSNRVSDSLTASVKGREVIQLHTYDLFLYNVKTRSPLLRRITNTPGVSETQPMAWDDTHFTYLSDQNGVRNRFVGYFDSAIAFVDTVAHYRYFARAVPVTNYQYSIVAHDVAPASGQYAEIVFHSGRWHVYTQQLKSFTELSPQKLRNTIHRDRVIEIARIDAEIDSIAKANPPKPLIPQQKMQMLEPAPTPRSDSSFIDINNYTFGNKPVPKTVKDSVPQTATPATDSVPKSTPDPFLLPIVRNYYVQYSIEYLTAQLDNSFLNIGYQRFTGGNSPVYLNPGFTGLFKIGLTDLLEDRKLTGGVRLSASLQNNEYLLMYEDRTRRLDKTWILHRQAFQRVNGTGGSSKILTQEARYGVKWPISEVASVRGLAGYRNDRRVVQSVDNSSLNARNTYFNAANLKVEFVYDNTIKRGLNLYNGMRFKVFAETFQGLDSLWGANKKSNRWFKNDLYAVGVDFRYYLRIHREFILATRISGATSFGREKLVYYMGGVDNWLFPKFDQSVRVSPDENYAYQTLATPMRGFQQNIRNGHSFALINAELRMPIFRYLLNRPLRSDFINNFQIIGFGDLGTAWTGKSPYDPSNSLNTTYIGAPGNPIVVVLQNHKEPLVGGFGWGLRSRIWGYFVRFDVAWGVEDRLILPRQMYLSFSLDF
ncbi:MAG: PD40 domain-containing protein [Bacteroidetes bacterium]|nr:PD40 domain-containing protein [Bacteroidota bacterium]